MYLRIRRYMATTARLRLRSARGRRGLRVAARPLPRLGPVPEPRSSARRVRSRTLDGDPQEHATIALHGSAIVVPVRVLPGDLPVVLDEAFHGLWQGHYL